MGVEGRILSGVGGRYTVEQADGTRLTCCVRGALRQQALSPLAGDFVTVSQSAEQGVIDGILPRRNAFIRPPVANVDTLVLVMSLVSPLPNATVVDKMLAVAEDKDVEPVLVINKTDLADPTPWQELYATTGYPLFLVSAETGAGVDALKVHLQGKVSVFTGNSGVGKSSLLNALDARLSLETGETSEKLGRGRHTTRQSCLYPQPNGGYIVDTPGFSSLDMEWAEWIPAERLPLCFPDFAPYRDRCRFVGCRHREEAGCAVRQAVEQGHIHPSRYDSYRRILTEVEKRPIWEKTAKAGRPRR